MFVALDIERAMRMRHLRTAASPTLQYFPNYLINGTIFEKIRVIEHKMCVLILSTILSEILLIIRRTDRDMIKIHIDLHACSRQIFEKYSNIKFDENPSSWSRVVPCELTDRRSGI